MITLSAVQNYAQISIHDAKRGTADQSLTAPTCQAQCKTLHNRIINTSALWQFGVTSLTYFTEVAFLCTILELSCVRDHIKSFWSKCVPFQVVLDKYKWSHVHLMYTGLSSIIWLLWGIDYMSAKSICCSQAGVAKWSTAPYLLHAARTVMGLSPKPPPILADISAGTWIKKAQLPCWPLYSQQVSHQRWISGIHCMQATKHASEESTLALKLRGDVTRSPKQGYQWPHKKDSCPPKYFLKKVNLSHCKLFIHSKSTCLLHLNLHNMAYLKKQSSFSG